MQEKQTENTTAIEVTKELTSIPRMMAPSSRNRVMWLVRLNGPVSQIPACTLSSPPLFLLIALMAFSNARVFRATPSPTPPKSVRLNATGGLLEHELNGAPKKILTPSTMFFCQMTTEANPIKQRTVKSFLCDERIVGKHRFRSDWW